MHLILLSAAVSSSSQQQPHKGHCAIIRIRFKHAFFKFLVSYNIRAYFLTQAYMCFKGPVSAIILDLIVLIG
jgi:hypothetical protein